MGWGFGGTLCWSYPGGMTRMEVGVGLGIPRALQRVCPVWTAEGELGASWEILYNSVEMATLHAGLCQNGCKPGGF